MTAPTVAPALNCPAWCVASHAEDSDVHLQDDMVVLDIYGNRVLISAWWVERAGTAGIYVGDYEFPVDQLDALEAAIRVAKLAAGRVTR